MEHINGGSTESRGDWKATAGRGVLLTVIGVGIWFRMVGLEWGIPNALPAGSSAHRNSFHIDEDDYLRGLLNIRPQAWDFDVRDYHWGTLQFYLVGSALAAAHWTGYLVRPWRDCLLSRDPNDFGRLYVAGRTVSAIAGILTLAAVFAVARSLKNVETGLGAAALLAVAPLHVVNSHFLTSDVTMVFLLILSLYFYIASPGGAKGWSDATGAFLLGLAISAKYNALFLAPLWISRVFTRNGYSWRARASISAAMAAGFCLGEPYALVHPLQAAESVYRAHFLNAAAVNHLPWWRLGLEQESALGQFGLQWSVLIPAAAGFVFCVARPSRKRMALAASIALMTLSLAPARWPMLRYTLPLIPLAAISAALLVSELHMPPWSRPWTVVLVGLAPLLVSWAHIRVLAGEHPANLASAWIGTNVPQGSRIGQIWPEIPPLDDRKYNVRSLGGLFEGYPPSPSDLDREYLVLDNLPIRPFGPDFRARLEREYVLVTEFRSDPHIGPWKLNEEGAPHDWKYTHPVVRIYARKQGRTDFIVRE